MQLVLTCCNLWLKKTKLVVQVEGDLKIYYIGFARIGWTEDALRYAESLKMLRSGAVIGYGQV